MPRRRAEPASVLSTRSIRQEMNGIDEAPGKTWFWELDAGVIDAGRCIQCGTCVAVCPSDSIGVDDRGLPQLVKMCTGCSLCWDFCPRGGLRYEATWPKTEGAGGDGLGLVQASYTARSRRVIRAQDGGIVTAILAAGLGAGDLDGVLLARESPTERWKGVAHLATTPEEVAACGGSFYNQTMGLAHLDLRDVDLPPDPRIAVVGTPCQIQGITAMRSAPWPRGSAQVEAVVLTIALLCTKSFDYEALMQRELADKRGVDLDQVGKVDVIQGKMIVEDRGGLTLISEPVRDFHGAALAGCEECADFAGRGADISVGSVGSPDGWSSVLVRTDAGKSAFLRAAPEMELRDLERPEALARLDAYDRKVTLSSMARDFDPNGPAFISYPEHVAAYAGTERAPVPDRPITVGHPSKVALEQAAEPVPDHPVTGLALRAQPADRAVKDLEVPPEPIDELERVRALVLESPEAWGRLGASGVWITDALWPWWGEALVQAKMTKSAMDQVVAGYRGELWLWLMGERTWESVASGLAGRLERRAPPDRPGDGL
jgi:coenzyme F420 hydrogenase subunit beta